MNTVMEKIDGTGVLAVVSLPDPDKAVAVVDALAAGGIEVIEVTLRSEGALESIRRIKKDRPGFSVGAGTVLTVETAEAAMAAGAEFLVSPGFDGELLAFAGKKKIPYVPGCTGASELQHAVKCGLRYVKFFPAELQGGAAALKLLSGPFPGLKFLPTGGINSDNMESYLRLPCVAAVGGSFMAPADLICGEKYEEITALSAKAMEKSLGFTLAHVGINHENEGDAEKTVETLHHVFGLPIFPRKNCFFAGTAVKAMKFPFLGTKGHVGIATNSMARALYHLAKQGVAVDEEHFKYDDKNVLNAVYLKDEIGGFAFHIVRK